MGKVTGGLAAAGMIVLGACSTFGGESASIGERIILAGPTVPAPMAEDAIEVDCPSVSVAEGGAALQAYSGGRAGDAAALRQQITIGQIARECSGRADGSIAVKVGVEARALLGAGGSPGRYDVPVTMVVKRGSAVIASRVARSTITIPPGETMGSTVIVEDGLVVPPSAVDGFEIEVGLGAAAAPAARRRRG